MNMPINYDEASTSSTPAITTSTSLLERAAKAIKEFATLSEIMRSIGAMGVLASMFVFLTQNWAADTDIELFLLMLTQTILLSAAGFVMFKILKENKSARLFFGLGLISITVNFTVLGALFYHSFHLDAPQSDYAAYAHWVVTDTTTLIMATVGSIILLLPLSYFSFSVLSRPAAKQLMIGYFGLNILLLLPIRDPSIILGIALTVLIILSRLLMKKKSTNSFSSGTTWEGQFARIILFAPLAVFILRSMFWYEVDDIAVSMMLVSAYIIARQLSFATKNKLNTLVISLSLIVGIITAGWIASHLFSFYPLLVPTFVGLFLIVCIDAYIRAKDKIMQKAVYFIGSITTALLLTLNHFAFDMAVTFGIALAASFAIFSVAYWLRSLFNIVISIIMVLFLTLAYSAEIVDKLMHSGWLGLALSGVGIIILASLLDRYGALLKIKLSSKRQEFAKS